MTEDERNPAASKGHGRRFVNAAARRLFPSGDVPGTAASETVWTGCDGPPEGSWSDRRAKIVGIFSWLLVGTLAVWLHVTDFQGFVDSFPYVVGTKVLIFVWVLVGVTFLRPIFTRRARDSSPDDSPEQ